VQGQAYIIRELSEP